MTRARRARARRDECPLCWRPRPAARDMSWLAITGIPFGIWRGFIWMPGGYAHRECFGQYAALVRREMSW